MLTSNAEYVPCTCLKFSFAKELFCATFNFIFVLCNPLKVVEQINTCSNYYSLRLNINVSACVYTGKVKSGPSGLSGWYNFIPNFCSIEQSKVFLHPPGWNAESIPG